MGRKIVLASLGLAFLYLISPLLLPVLMGAILAVVFVPLLNRLVVRRRVPRRLAAVLLTIGVTVVILLPSAFLIFAGVKSGMQQLQALKDAPKGGGNFVDALMNHPAMVRLTDMATTWFPVSAEDIANTLHDLVAGIGKTAAELLGALLSALPRLALEFVLIVVSLFFALADGMGLVTFVRANTVFTKSETDKLLLVVSGACRSVVVASVASAIAQALIEMVAVWVAGIPNPALIGLIVFVSSFIPVIGSAPVTFGVAIHQLVFGHGARGVALLVVAVVVAGVDNVVRALFLQGSANLHPLIAFMAALGGLSVMGFPGVFIGPIIAVVFLSVVQMSKKAAA
jgi:predicted PurR-regulated permease PerM